MASSIMSDGVIDLDDRPAQAAINRTNAGLDDHEKRVKTILDRTGREWQVHGDTVVRVTDRSKSSLDGLLRSMERQSALAGKTGVDRQIAELDLLTRKWRDNDQAMQAILRTREKLAEPVGGGGFAESIKNFIQNPMEGAKAAASGLLEKLGPVGVGLGIGATALTAFGAAAWESAKSLGELGVRTEDAKLRLGMTTKEVGEFSFAAKVAGQDIGIFERMMRGLTTAVEDDSAAGQKARKWLTEFGVDLQGVKSGTVSTADVMKQIAGGMEKLSHSPDPFAERKAMLDLFKKVGIEAIPVMEHLNENWKLAHEYGFGLDDAELARFLKYQQSITIIEEKYAEMKREFQEGLVIDVRFLGDAAKFLLDYMPGERVNMPSAAAGKMQRESDLVEEIRQANAAKLGNAPSPNLLTTLQRRRIEALRGLKPEDAWSLYPPARGEHDYRDPHVVRQLQAAQQWQDQIDMIQALGRKKAIPKPAPEPVKASAEQKEAARIVAELQRKDALEGQSEERKRVIERDLGLAKLRELHATTVQLAAAAKAYNDLILDARVAEHVKDLNAALKGQQEAWKPLSELLSGEDDQLSKSREKGLAAAMKVSGEDAKKREATDSAIEAINLQSQRDTLNREAGRAQKMVAASGMTGEDAIRATYQIRIGLAEQLAVVEMARIASESNGAKAAEDSARALATLAKDTSEAQEEAIFRQMELQRTQLDSLKRDTEGLWSTLLTHPAKFGKQLSDTVHAAVIKPVAEGMAGLTATMLKPIIYGADGGGGLASVFKGVFGGGKKDLTVVTDRNSDVTEQNTSALRRICELFTGVSGSGAPGLPSIMSAARAPIAASMAMLAGLAGAPMASAASQGGYAPAPGSYTAAPRFGGGSGGADWSGGSAGVPMLSRASGGGGFNPLATLFGGGRGAAGSPGDAGSANGIAGILKGFKGTNWGSFKRGPSNPTYGTDEQGSDVITGDTAGKITGVNGVAGAALSGGGMMLANAGLLGNNRGTWGGIAEGTAGGAMIGMQMAGPFGAAIGAGAGFAIGGMEKLLGIVSPETKAKELVKQIYNLSINNSTAKQIASMATSQYGGNVSMAVRSPEVRQLLQLYAESTGQKSNLWLNNPHGVSLTEHAGTLYQSAVYNNGVGYTYASNLPVMGSTAGTIPTSNPYAGGNFTVQVSAEQTANLWQVGTAAAIASGSRAVADSAVNGQAAGASRIFGASTMLSPDTVAF